MSTFKEEFAEVRETLQEMYEFREGLCPDERTVKEKDRIQRVINFLSLPLVSLDDVERVVEEACNVRDSAFLTWEQKDAVANAWARILVRLRSNLEPEGEKLTWEDWPIGVTATLKHREGKTDTGFKLSHSEFVVTGFPIIFEDDEFPCYDPLWTILSIDNQTEGEEAK